jgi:uncharacterized membrane protein YgdD (TMEM256/DUF423 family)
MQRTFFLLGALSAFISVAAGAFGAHGLKDKLAPDMMTVFETAARYQMYHAFALLVTALAFERWAGGALRAGGWLFLAGTILFCGSLYALSLSGVKILGAVTPFGGVAFLGGWVCLAYSAFAARN